MRGRDDTATLFTAISVNLNEKMSSSDGSPEDQAISEEKRVASEDVKNVKDDTLVLDAETKTAHQYSEEESGSDSEGKIIITGADAAKYLLPLRDDGEPALTFRSIFLASGLAAFQAVMSEIYYVSWQFGLLTTSPNN